MHPCPLHSSVTYAQFAARTVTVGQKTLSKRFVKHLSISCTAKCNAEQLHFNDSQRAIMTQWDDNKMTAITNNGIARIVNERAEEDNIFITASPKKKKIVGLDGLKAPVEGTGEDARGSCIICRRTHRVTECEFAGRGLLSLPSCVGPRFYEQDTYTCCLHRFIYRQTVPYCTVLYRVPHTSCTRFEEESRLDFAIHQCT